MSKRNSQTAKTAARERLRVERERQAKRDKVRRQFVVGGAVVGVLALGAGIAVAVVKMNAPSYWEKAADQKLVAPANSTGKNGTSIEIGDANAKHTLKVYEDLRCPVCAQFEQTSGEEVQKDATAGKYKISYTMGAFLDDALKQGQGSKNALSALGAALNVSKDAFVQYHALLYSKDVHPEETKDDFGSDAKLIEIAQKVTALKGNKTFENAVRNGTYDKWALTMAKQFDTDGIQGTPTVKLDGKTIENVQTMTPQQFTAAVDAQIGAKQ
ncbi:thioredoxin domain-containing protein [Streptomyces sp. NPDC058691]|uniref:thioredoxin domain-containing protein n=1 Tax=Streptomyces sp. NPDC058691 TaxID=3346601 RepID=UPI003659B941